MCGDGRMGGWEDAPLDFLMSKYVAEVGWCRQSLNQNKIGRKTSQIWCLETRGWSVVRMMTAWWRVSRVSVVLMPKIGPKHVRNVQKAK